MPVMAMWSSGFGMSLAMVRLTFGLAGIAAVVWASTVFPVFRMSTPVREIASRILADDRFKPGVIDGVLASIDRSPELPLMSHAVTRTEAILRVRWAEEAMMRRGTDEGDLRAAISEQKVRHSLTISPVDSFLWLKLYSLSSALHGFDVRNIAYLDQSYATGPFEGWIALQRNRLALAAFSMLSEVTRQKAEIEFAAIVDSGFVEAAAISLTNVGWLQRDRLLASLDRADVISREQFAKWLAREGVKVDVPGIVLEERFGR
ncbi:hypothetical protein CV770_24225 [Bradyrhizobium sp. AC87j1]|nr:hypothetical protein CV770_24225 [Bradyrhizobium sp. AC87j1]